MWWEQLLVFTVLAVAGYFVVRRVWRGLVGGKPCCNCGSGACSARRENEFPAGAATTAAAPLTAGPGQVSGDAA